MELSKKQFYTISAILILLALVYIFFENPITRKKILATISPSYSIQKTETSKPISKENTLSINPCLYFRTQYGDVTELKKAAHQVRFINIHKKINNEIFRLRQFYKEANEGEQLIYLLYKEDQNNEDHLIEKSAYKKGPKYLKIEKQTGEIIYTEEAFNLGDDQGLFLHFVNQKLKSLQGLPPDSQFPVPLNCLYKD